MDKKTKIRLISLSSAFIVLAGALVFKNDREEKVIERNTIEDTENSNKDIIYYENNILDIQDELKKFNVKNLNYYPVNSYKILQYRDVNGYERFSVVLSNIGYYNDEKGNIDTYYSFVDVFDGTLVLSSNNLNFELFASDFVDTIIYYGDLTDLGDILENRGLDKDYIKKVKEEYISSNMLYSLDAAKYYLSLVNDYNRSDYETHKALIIK